MNEPAVPRCHERLLICLVLCFVIRAGMGLWLMLERTAEFIGGDGAEYLDTACNLASGKGYLISGPRIWDVEYYDTGANRLENYPRPELFRPPLYSISLAALARLDGRFCDSPLYWVSGLDRVAETAKLSPVRLWMIPLWNALLATIAGWFLFDLGRRAIGPLAALWALLLYGVYPLAFMLSARVAAESLFGACFGACVWCLWRAREERPFLYAALAGLALGLATLTRSNSVFFWLLGSAWLFWCVRRHRFTVVWFTLVFALTLLPWAIRNRIVAGQWIVLSASGPYNLWLGNNEVAYKMFTSSDSAEYDRWGRVLLQEVVPEKVREMGPRDLAGTQQFWYAGAKEYMRQHPLQWIRLLAAKSVEFWRPYVRPGFFPRSYVVLSLVSTLPLFILGGWGMGVLFRREPALAWLLLLVVVSGMIGLVLSHVHVRLRVPFVDIFFTLPAALVLVSWWKRIRAWGVRSKGP